MNINTIHTPCKNCVFALYEDKTQTGCGLNYISKYKEHDNVQILEAYDNEKEFYIINNKKCIGYREPKWFNQFDMVNASLEEKIQKYKETNSLQYLLVIELKNINIDQFSSLCYQIANLAIKPQKIIFIRHIDEKLSFPYDSIKNIFEQTKLGIPWRIQTMIDAEWSYHDTLHNIITINAKYRFICAINEYSEDLNNILSMGNSIVHEDLDQFVVLTNNEKTCILFSSLVYRYSIMHDKTNILSNADSYTIV